MKKIHAFITNALHELMLRLKCSDCCPFVQSLEPSKPLSFALATETRVRHLGYFQFGNKSTPLEVKWEHAQAMHLALDFMRNMVWKSERLF